MENGLIYITQLYIYLSIYLSEFMHVCIYACMYLAICLFESGNLSIYLSRHFGATRFEVTPLSLSHLIFYLLSLIYKQLQKHSISPLTLSFFLTLSLFILPRSIFLTTYVYIYLSFSISLNCYICIYSVATFFEVILSRISPGLSVFPCLCLLCSLSLNLSHSSLSLSLSLSLSQLAGSFISLLPSYSFQLTTPLLNKHQYTHAFSSKF
ncbi:unnamed protein product [Acanthosepion pharaonis]|uniref:Uncharacterized protein n=1 Tax=Acanthosepion pharaonis TaxID=158019 RepID=A0A812BZN7_ACAPH|nr:unnamed protein product [Sepia pharaonis]